MRASNKRAVRSRNASSTARWHENRSVSASRLAPRFAARRVAFAVSVPSISPSGQGWPRSPQRRMAVMSAAYPFLLCINPSGRLLTKMEVSGALSRPIKSAAMLDIADSPLDDGSLRPFKRQASGDFLQVGKDRSNMRPGKVCWIVDVTICASDDFPDLATTPRSDRARICGSLS